MEEQVDYVKQLVDKLVAMKVQNFGISRGDKYEPQAAAKAILESLERLEQGDFEVVADFNE